MINGAINEHFLDMHKLDAAALTDSIISVLDSIISVLTEEGIDVKQCIAQWYDGDLVDQCVFISIAMPIGLI